MQRELKLTDSSIQKILPRIDSCEYANSLYISVITFGMLFMHFIKKWLLGRTPRQAYAVTFQMPKVSFRISVLVSSVRRSRPQLIPTLSLGGLRPRPPAHVAARDDRVGVQCALADHQSPGDGLLPAILLQLEVP